MPLTALRWRPNGTLPALLLTAAFLPAAHAEAPRTDALLELNKEFRKTYSRSRAAVLARTGPVIIVDGDKLTLLHGKERTEADVIPALYHHLKAVAHLPLTTYLLLADCDEGPMPAERRAELRRLRELAVAARDGLGDRGFSAAQLERQKKLVAESLAALDAALEKGRCPSGDRTAFARRAAPLVLANAADAARAQIDAYHARVSAWRKKLTPREWGKLRVIVMGSQMPRKNHTAVQYFARLLGEKGEGKRIVYAEALYDERRALNLLGTHLLDGEIASDFFDEPLRMERDLLGDAAAEYLRTMKMD